MTATVVDLARSRRPRRRTAETCRACRRGADGRIRECYPHRLESLARRLSLADSSTAGELLIPRDALEVAITDALAVIAGITDECLIPEDERTART